MPQHNKEPQPDNHFGSSKVLIKDTLRQYFIYGIGSIAQSALSVILLPVYMRFFDPAQYGVISILVIISTLFTLVGSAGVTNGLIRLYYEKGSGQRQELIGNSFSWYIFASLLGGVLLVLCANPLSSLLFQQADYSYSIRLVGILYVVSMMQILPFMIFRLDTKPTLFVSFSLARAVIDFALKLLFILPLGRGINGYFEAGVLANCAILVALIPFMAPYLKLSINKYLIVKLLRLGAPYILSGLTVWMLQQSDRFILNYFRGESAVGVYSLAGTYASIFSILLAQPITLLIDPLFFSFTAKRPPEQVKIFLQRMLAYSFIGGGVIFLIVSLSFNEVMQIMTVLFKINPGYAAAGVLVPWLTLSPFIYFLCLPAILVALLIGKPEYISYASLISAAVGIGSNLLLVPRLGALGAAFSSIIAYVILMLTSYIWLRRPFPIDYRWGTIIIGIAYLGISYFTGWIVPIDNPWVSLPIKLTVSVGVFCLLAWHGGLLLHSEKKAILAIVKRDKKD